MALPDKLQIAGLSPDTVYSTLVKKGVSDIEATSFVAEWMLSRVGKGPRTFQYSSPFAATDPDCVSKFGRAFAHTDWVDGESVVQAQETVGEAGFNTRFHKIEADLDAVGADVAKAFACVQEMRKELNAALDEIRLELNRINTDLNNLGNKTGPLTINPGFAQGGSFLGTTKIGPQSVSMWQTPAGMFILPALSVVNPNPAEDPRVQRAATIARFTEETAGVRAAFNNQPFTVADFNTKFGNVSTPDGTLVRDLTDILPTDARFATVDLMIDELSTREAAALRTSAGADAAVTAALGLQSDAQTAGSASVSKIETLSQDAQNALAKNGIDTIAKLGSATPAKVTEILRREGVTNVTAGDVASVTTVAKTLTRVRQ